MPFLFELVVKKDAQDDRDAVLIDKQRRYKAMKKRFLIGAAVLLTSILVVGCGIPQEEYDAMSAERDALMVEKATLTTTVNYLESDLDEAESQITILESDLTDANS